MSERTNHGDNIADQIQTHDAYGQFNPLTYADVWNIIDQLQTHFFDYAPNDEITKLFSKWMRELERLDSL